MEVIIYSIGGVVIALLAAWFAILVFRQMDARVKMAEKDDKIRRLTNKNPDTNLQRDLEKATKDRNDLQRSLEAKERSYSQLGGEYNTLQAQLEDARRERDAKERDREELEVKLNSTEILLTNTRTNNGKLETELRSSKEYQGRIEHQVADLQRQLTESQRDTVAKEQARATLEQEAASVTSQLENTQHELGQANVEFNRVQTLYEDMAAKHEKVFDNTVSLTEALVEARARLTFLKSKCGDAAIWFLEERYTDDNPEVEAAREEANDYVEQLKNPPVHDPVEERDGDYSETPHQEYLPEMERLIPGIDERLSNS